MSIIFQLLLFPYYCLLLPSLVPNSCQRVAADSAEVAANGSEMAAALFKFLQALQVSCMKFYRPSQSENS